jgi:hypothetical protein
MANNDNGSPDGLGKHVYTPIEMMNLADRMIARGTSKMMTGQDSLQRDCLACGRILATLLLNEVITQSVVVGKNPPNSGITKQ